MGWLDDLKKKGQQATQQAQSAVQQGTQAANQAYNTGKQVVQQVKQNAPGVVSTVQNGIQKGIQKANDVANTTKNMVQNVKNGVENAIATGKETYNVGKAGYDGAVSGVKDYYVGDSNTQAPPQETDWAAEYDKVMQGDGQGTSAPTQSNIPTSSTPATNPDGTVTVTQPNGQPINTSPAANDALGAGAGQWQSELDGIMNQIMNREKFSFDMNGDAMYQQYADMYQNQANLGMQNAMAQAAALTGGYGSSYGQMVGQQAYAQQMQGLNDVALDLYDRAYNQYQDEGNQLAQQYAMLADREQQAYNRDYQANRDAVADEQWDQSFEYQKYLDELNQSNYEKEFAYQQSQDKQAQSNYENEFNYQKDRDSVADSRYEQEWNASEEQRKADNQYRNDVFEYEQERDTIADDRYNKEFEYQQGRDAINDERYENEWAASEEQRKADNKYRDETLKEDQRQFDESMNWQVDEFNKMYGYTDENGVYHQGINEKEREDIQTHDKEMAKQEHDWQVDEFNKMYGYTDENGEYHKGYYETQSDKEFDRMYGDLKYDKKGNVIGGGYQTQRDAIEDKRYDDALKAQEEANNPNTTYEGETGTLVGKTVPKSLAHVDGLTTTNTNLFDDNGHFKTAAVVSSDGDKGTTTYNIGGKEVTLKTGTSPYTNTVNPDAKKGVMENGYQPDNVGSYYKKADGTVDEGKAKLSATGQTDVINGQTVPVYKDGTGKKWIYDASSNGYMEYVDDEEEKPKTNESGEYKIGAGGGGGGKKPVYIAHD